MQKITRRNMLATSTGLAGALAAGLPLLGQETGPGLPQTSRKLKVVVAGAHPDAPESGCGGTIARYSDLGHEVVIIYLTRGEVGIDGKSPKEAAEIRTAECQKACGILNARPIFAGQIDGSTEVNGARYDQFHKILESEKPSVLFTHWPIDTHPDHRAVSLLTYDYWLRSGREVALFYFEVDEGSQTQNFSPTHYVNITQTEGRKRAACFAHVSQQPETTFYPLHDRMNQFRGMEYGTRVAEAFVRHCQDPGPAVPGL